MRDWILFFTQILTLVALVIYVWKTWEMASATRRAAEASAAAVREAIDARLEALAPRILVYFGYESLHLAENRRGKPRPRDRDRFHDSV